MSYSQGRNSRFMAYENTVKCEVCHVNESQPGRPNCTDGFCISVAMVKLRQKQIEQEQKALAYLGKDGFKLWKKQRETYLANLKEKKAIQKNQESKVDKLESQDSVTIAGYLTESPEAEEILSLRK